MPIEDTKKRALRMLDRRDYGRDELIEKLIEKGEPPEDAQAVADRFCQLHIIDDARYASLVVRHFAAKGFGRSRVKNELFKRRIPRELWDAALLELPETDETLDRLLRAKLRGDIDDRAALKRATDALLRRGFGWSEISSAVERLRAGLQQE